jgi:microcystin-dependent protein
MPGRATLIFGSRLLVLSRRMAWALALALCTGLCSVPAAPAAALDLFATHEVTTQFATPDGKPMTNAEVRVFAPGDPSKVALTGRTDADGKFVFDADRDGFWSAEAHSADYVARVMIRVGGQAEPHNQLSPFLLIGFLVVLLGLAIWYRLLRARTRGPRP